LTVSFIAMFFDMKPVLATVSQEKRIIYEFDR